MGLFFFYLYIAMQQTTPKFSDLKQSCYHLFWLCWFNGHSWVILQLHVMLTRLWTPGGSNGLKYPEWPSQVAGSWNCLSAGGTAGTANQSTVPLHWLLHVTLTSHCMAVRGNIPRMRIPKGRKQKFLIET